MFFDESYRQLAQDSQEASKDTDAAALQCIELPDIQPLSAAVTEDNLPEEELSGPIYSVSAHDVAYLHHTSGTSTGLPKPIAQTHHAGIGVLPCLDGSKKASFSTTPLYHGGIADCFRAWASGAMMWLFPGKDAPITASNIMKCMQSIQIGKPELLPTYFSSVPYILQMLAEDKAGLDCLREMEIVGVGGAALPAAVGDDLVSKDLNLISRFGSAECGFLMSSHRQYSKDAEWQYLRSSSGVENLRFEPREEGLAELVVLPGWPHMAKRNRPDGSYATADLFEPHASIPNAWRYHSRADSQLTLITGKKFDPAPIESAIATSPLLKDVFVFGEGQQYPGALLFISNEASGMSADRLLSELWPHVQKLNEESQSHTRISRAMLVPMSSDEPPLEKSSKGTILRGQVEKRFKARIDAAYKGTDAEEGASYKPVPDDELPIAVLDMIRSVVGDKGTLAADADLFGYGVDSVACMQIRNRMQRVSGILAQTWSFTNSDLRRFCLLQRKSFH